MDECENCISLKEDLNMADAKIEELENAISGLQDTITSLENLKYEVEDFLKRADRYL